MSNETAATYAFVLRGIQGDAVYNDCYIKDVRISLVAFEEKDAQIVNQMLEPDRRTGRCCWFGELRDTEPLQGISSASYWGSITTGHWGAMIREYADESFEVTFLEDSAEVGELWDYWVFHYSHEGETEDVSTTG